MTLTWKTGWQGFDVVSLRNMAVRRQLVTEIEAKKLRKPALVELIEEDNARCFATRNEWSRNLSDPDYCQIVEVASYEPPGHLLTLRAVVTEYGGAQDDLRVEVMSDWCHDCDDLNGVEADVSIVHRASTVRGLRWEGQVLYFSVDEGESSYHVDFADYSMFCKDRVRARVSR